MGKPAVLGVRTRLLVYNETTHLRFFFAHFELLGCEARDA
jgi:hypothetical protein